MKRFLYLKGAKKFLHFKFVELIHSLCGFFTLHMSAALSCKSKLIYKPI